MIGAAIREIREEKGLRQIDVAEACGWSTGVPVSKYESGTRNPSDETLERIADALDVTPADIRHRAEQLQEDEEQTEENEPTEGRTVRTSADVNRWRDAVSRSDVEFGMRMILMVLPAFQALPEEDDYPLVLVTEEQLAEEANLPEEMVEESWPAVLESDWVERVGRVEWALRLVFPEE